MYIYIIRVYRNYIGGQVDRRCICMRCQCEIPPLLKCYKISVTCCNVTVVKLVASKRSGLLNHFVKHSGSFSREVTNITFKRVSVMWMFTFVILFLL